MMRAQCLGWLGALVIAAFVAPPRVETDEQELAWAEDVLLRGDLFLSATRTGTRRWLTSPTLTIIGGTKEQKKVVADVVKHLNETLEKTPIKGIELRKPNDSRATIKVQFARRARLASVAQVYGMNPGLVKAIKKKKWTYVSGFSPAPANPWVVGAGVLLVSSDKEDGRLLASHALQGLCMVLGLINHSKRYEKSIFFEDGDRKSERARLSERDRKLILWYYNHVPPGTDTLNMLFDKHWPRKE